MASSGYTIKDVMEVLDSRIFQNNHFYESELVKSESKIREVEKLHNQFSVGVTISEQQKIG